MKNIFIPFFLLFSTLAIAQTNSIQLSSDVWPPFTNVEGEKSIALDIVAEALQSIDISVDYHIIDFEDVMDGIASGTYDGSGALWLEKSREETMLFSDPYLQNQLILVGRKGSNVLVKAISEFKGKRIGVVENYAYGDFLEDDKNNQIIYGESDQQNLERLLSEQIDYFLVDALLIQYLLKYQLNDVSEFLEIGKNPLVTKSLHLAIRKDVPDADQIITQFNTAISGMIADGSYNEILGLNWISADIDGDGIIELVFVGNEAGKTAPDNSYNVLYSDTSQQAQVFYVNGKKYNSWDDVPQQNKVDIPKEYYQPSLDDASMKIRF